MGRQLQHVDGGRWQRFSCNHQKIHQRKEEVSPILSEQPLPQKMPSFRLQERVVVRETSSMQCIASLRFVMDASAFVDDPAVTEMKSN